MFVCDEIIGLIIVMVFVCFLKDFCEVLFKLVCKCWKLRVFVVGVDCDYVEEVIVDFLCECYEGKFEFWEYVGNVFEVMKGVVVEFEFDGCLVIG